MTTKELMSFRENLNGWLTQKEFTAIPSSMLICMSEALNEHINLRLNFEKNKGGSLQ